MTSHSGQPERVVRKGSAVASEAQELNPRKFFPRSMRRLSEQHTELNKTVRIVGAGLTSMEVLAASNPTSDSIAPIVAKTSEHWEGTVPFADLCAEIKVATVRVAQLFVVSSVASFEEFLNAFQAETDNAAVCSADGASGLDQTDEDEAGWSGLTARYDALWNRLAPDNSSTADRDDWLLIADVFVRVRNRIAHSSGCSSAAALSAKLQSRELSKAWGAVAAGTVSKRLPKLLVLPKNGGLPELNLPHAILASVVFHRLAASMCDQMLRIDSERRVLALAVNEVLVDAGLPKDTEERVRRLNVILRRGSCVHWSGATIGPALRQHGLWDRLRGRVSR